MAAPGNADRGCSGVLGLGRGVARVADALVGRRRPAGEMAAVRETVYSFKAKWFDTHAQYVRVLLVQATACCCSLTV